MGCTASGPSEVALSRVRPEGQPESGSDAEKQRLTAAPPHASAGCLGRLCSRTPTLGVRPISLTRGRPGQSLGSGRREGSSSARSQTTSRAKGVGLHQTSSGPMSDDAFAPLAPDAYSKSGLFSFEREMEDVDRKLRLRSDGEPVVTNSPGTAARGRRASAPLSLSTDTRVLGGHVPAAARSANTRGAAPHGPSGRGTSPQHPGATRGSDGASGSIVDMTASHAGGVLASPQVQASVSGAAVLDELRMGGLSAQEIQQVYASTMALQRSPEFYITVGELLIQKSEPLMAEDILYNGSKQYPHSLRLKQLHCRALAQGGSAEKAIALLEGLRSDMGTEFDEESGGLLARCYKDLAGRQKSHEQRAEYLTKAHAIYKESYERSGRTSYYTGINTATMSLLLGNEAEARTVADEVVRICELERNGWGTETPKGAYWALATLGEASLIAGHLRHSLYYYSLAVAAASNDYMKLSSTKRQLQLLLDYVDIPDVDLSALEKEDLSIPGLGAGAAAGALLPLPAHAGAFKLPNPVKQRVRELRIAMSRRRTEARKRGRQSARGRAPGRADTELGALRMALFDSIFDLPRVAVFITAEIHEGVVPAPGAQAMMAAHFDMVLGKVKAHFGYACPTTVADIVFLEAVKRRGGDIYIVLPVPLDVHLKACAPKFAEVEALTGETCGPFGSRYLEMYKDDAPLADACQSAQGAGGAEPGRVSASTMFDEFGVLRTAQKHRASMDDRLLPAQASATDVDDAEDIDSATSRNDDPLPRSNLLSRMRALLATAARVDISNDMSPETSVTNRHYCSLILNGLAVMRARTLCTSVERIYLTPNVMKRGEVVGQRPGDEVVHEDDAVTEMVDVSSTPPSAPVPALSPPRSAVADAVLPSVDRHVSTARGRANSTAPSAPDSHATASAQGRSLQREPGASAHEQQRDGFSHYDGPKAADKGGGSARHSVHRRASGGAPGVQLGGKGRGTSSARTDDGAGPPPAADRRMHATVNTRSGQALALGAYGAKGAPNLLSHKSSDEEARQREAATGDVLASLDAAGGVSTARSVNHVLEVVAAAMSEMTGELVSVSLPGRGTSVVARPRPSEAEPAAITAYITDTSRSGGNSRRPTGGEMSGHGANGQVQAEHSSASDKRHGAGPRSSIVRAVPTVEMLTEPSRAPVPSSTHETGAQVAAQPASQLSVETSPARGRSHGGEVDAVSAMYSNIASPTASSTVPITMPVVTAQHVRSSSCSTPGAPSEAPVVSQSNIMLSAPLRSDSTDGPAPPRSPSSARRRSSLDGVMASVVVAARARRRTNARRSSVDESAANAANANPWKVLTQPLRRGEDDDVSAGATPRTDRRSDAGGGMRSARSSTEPGALGSATPLAANGDQTARVRSVARLSITAALQAGMLGVATTESAGSAPALLADPSPRTPTRTPSGSSAGNSTPSAPLPPHDSAHLPPLPPARLRTMSGAVSARAGVAESATSHTPTRSSAPSSARAPSTPAGYPTTSRPAAVDFDRDVQRPASRARGQKDLRVNLDEAGEEALSSPEATTGKRRSKRGPAPMPSPNIYNFTRLGSPIAASHREVFDDLLLGEDLHLPAGAVPRAIGASNAGAKAAHIVQSTLAAGGDSAVLLSQGDDPHSGRSSAARRRRKSSDAYRSAGLLPALNGDSDTEAASRRQRRRSSKGDPADAAAAAAAAAADAAPGSAATTEEMTDYTGQPADTHREHLSPQTDEHEGGSDASDDESWDDRPHSPDMMVSPEAAAVFAGIPSAVEQWVAQQFSFRVLFMDSVLTSRVAPLFPQADELQVIDDSTTVVAINSDAFEPTAHGAVGQGAHTVMFQSIPEHMPLPGQRQTPPPPMEGPRLLRDHDEDPTSASPASSPARPQAPVSVHWKVYSSAALANPVAVPSSASLAGTAHHGDGPVSGDPTFHSVFSSRTDAHDDSSTTHRSLNEDVSARENGAADNLDDVVTWVARQAQTREGIPGARAFNEGKAVPKFGLTVRALFALRRAARRHRERIRAKSSGALRMGHAGSTDSGDGGKPGAAAQSLSLSIRPDIKPPQLGSFTLSDTPTVATHQALSPAPTASDLRSPISSATASARAADASPVAGNVVHEEQQRLEVMAQKQVIMAILFADIVGYSKMGEMQVLTFVERFLGSLAALIEALPPGKQPKVRNTWGDACYFVFSRVPDAGAFALLFSDLVTRVPWWKLGLPKSLNIRISLHAAPVHPVIDPITQTKNYTGVHTSRAARIEPITPPGCVYCSQAFAAMSETLCVSDYECTYVGNVPLAKGYGLQPVRRRQLPDRTPKRTIHVVFMRFMQVYHVRWSPSSHRMQQFLTKRAGIIPFIPGSPHDGRVPKAIEDE